MASIIGVETLQHTNGTEAATIDSSGRILQPAKPAFSATTTTGTNQTSGVINYNKEIFDIGGNYNPTDKAFTCPVDGVYSFSFAYYCLVDANTCRAALHKNGTLYMYGHRVEGNLNENGTTTIILECSANDVIDIRHESGEVHVNTNYTHFSGYLIG